MRLPPSDELGARARKHSSFQKQQVPRIRRKNQHPPSVASVAPRRVPSISSVYKTSFPSPHVCVRQRSRRPTGAGDRLNTSQTKPAGGDPRRPRRLRRCASQDRSRGRNYTSNRGGHATYNGCVRLDTSGTRQLVEAVRAAYSRCCHAYLITACVLPLAGFP
jgi:hypothetical protein